MCMQFISQLFSFPPPHKKSRSVRLCFDILIDGAELLLDLGLPASIIGGVILPLLGAIPDSAMIVFSGVGGSKEDANKQISVGMG